MKREFASSFRLFLSAFVLASVALGPVASKVLADGNCVAPPAGLVSWWRAEGNVLDSAGVNNGAVVGGVTFAPGEVGQAFNFSGTNCNVQIPASTSLDVGQSTNGFTVETWINPADANDKPIVDWTPLYSASNPTWYGVHLYASSMPTGSLNLYANVVDTAGNNHQLVTANNVITVGVFQHIAMTYNRTSGLLCLYVNGALSAQSNIGSFTPKTSYGLNIGCRLNGAPSDRCISKG